MCLQCAECIADQMNFLSNKKLNKTLGIICLILVVVSGTLISKYVGIKGSGQANAISCNGKKCNVILIVSDTLSAQHMSAYGYERDTTPFIKDYFEKNGVVFDNATSTASWTLPSFASMFRSRYPSEILLSELADKNDPTTFMSYLRSNGVDVAGAVESGMLIKESIFNAFKENEVVSGNGEAKFLSAGEWVRQRSLSGSKKPYFMLIHDWTVHDPYDPPEQYRSLFGEPKSYEGPVTHGDIEEVKKNGFTTSGQKQKFVRRYDQGVRHFDDLIKNFISGLDQETLDETVVIITGDHGEGFDEHGYFYHGAHIYQEFVHVPFLVRMPGAAEVRKITEPISLLDVGPTMLAFFGIEVPKTFKGNDLTSTILGKTKPDWTVKSELGGFELSLGGETSAFKKLSSEVLSHGVFSSSDMYAKILKNIKIIQAQNGMEIYNLHDDPFEKNDLSKSWKSMSESDRETISRLLEAE